jgi:hypothetical protein
MRVRRTLTGFALATVASASLAGGVASAAFPDYTGCPTTAPDVTACIDIQTIRGSLEIKGFTVPLGDSMEIRGGLVPPPVEGTVARFVPATGTNGLFTKPIQIPGGLLGIDFPIPGNAVTGTAQLAGPSSAIVVDFGIPNTIVRLPVKLKLDNPILGSNCYIGSNSNPVRLNLTTGTTSPPLPNRPISGSIGTPVFEAGSLQLLRAVSVDNAFAVPGATGCGLGLGLISALVNLKLGLPSSAGNNTMIVENNVGLRSLS